MCYSNILIYFQKNFLEKSKKKLPTLLMGRYLLAVSNCFRLYSVHVCCLDLLSVLINSAYLK